MNEIKYVRDKIFNAKYELIKNGVTNSTTGEVVVLYRDPYTDIYHVRNLEDFWNLFYEVVD